MTERFRAVAVVFHLIVLALVAPMLVLCEDGNRHAAVESAISFCCQDGTAGPSGANQAPEAGGAGNGCAGSCTDTPFLAGIDVPSPRSVVQRLEAVAAVLFVAPVSCPASAFARKDKDCWPAFSFPHLGRSTVLQI